ncbi:MAG: ribose 5-phosphate isomerase A [Ginsengibacter sp.]
MNLKQQAAQAAITLVENNQVVGLGAGSTIAHVVEFLRQKIAKGLAVKLVSSSFTTQQLLLKANIPCHQVASFAQIDIYLDGCDQFDKELNALKSGGGIHTQEKLLANMAAQFVIVGDEAKLVDNFDSKYPLVLEVLPEALSFVPDQIKNRFTITEYCFRLNDKRDGPVITPNGNYLLDVYFKSWPVLADINPDLKNIGGVVETSLFFGIARKAIIAGEDGIRILDRS